MGCLSQKELSLSNLFLSLTQKIICKFALTAVVLGCLLFGQVFASDEYVRISKYIDKHPEQKQVMDDFLNHVRESAQPIKQQPQQAIRIAMLYPSEQKSDYWMRSRDSFEKRLAALNIPYDLKYFASKPSGDSRKQSQQLAEALAWQPDYLVFTLDIAPQSRMIERLLANNTPKIILQNVTTPRSAWGETRPIMYVGFDHEQGSQTMAETMLKTVDYQGKYLMLYFTPGYVSQMRGDTFVNEARKHPKIVQVAAFYTDGNADKAYAATKKTLAEHPDLKMIFACSTDIALGALRALREMERTDVLLNGWGGGDAELRVLESDGLDLTVMRMNDDNGIAMAEAIKLDLLDRIQEVPHIFPGDIYLLSNDLSNEEVSAFKRRAFRLSGVPSEG